MTKFLRVPTKLCDEGSEFWALVATYPLPIGGYGVQVIQLCLHPYGIKSTYGLN